MVTSSREPKLIPPLLSPPFSSSPERKQLLINKLCKSHLPHSATPYCAHLASSELKITPPHLEMSVRILCKFKEMLPKGGTDSRESLKFPLRSSRVVHVLYSTLLVHVCNLSQIKEGEVLCTRGSMLQKDMQEQLRLTQRHNSPRPSGSEPSRQAVNSQPLGEEKTACSHYLKKWTRVEVSR